MRGNRAAWLIPLPLAVTSWLGAHCLAYWLISPGGERHMGMHAADGHAYLGYTPAVALWGLALLLAGLVLCVWAGMRGGRLALPPVRLFFYLPPVGFALQEHIERLVGTGGVPPDLALEPTFVVGLALQLPFAVAALLLAHALGAIGFGVGREFSHRLAFPPWMSGTPAARLRLRARTRGTASAVLAPGHGPRAPPASAGL
ncbi:MAG TPA: hypothetical protein VHF45_10725, partial [Thermoleophilaceae bacterium]|nr:hypothetical protein [Thermoleophilaceae bacterium]